MARRVSVPISKGFHCCLVIKCLHNVIKNSHNIRKSPHNIMINAHNIIKCIHNIVLFLVISYTWMIGALGPVCTDEAIFGPEATWVNEANFLDETHPRHRIDHSTWRSAAQRATN